MGFETIPDTNIQYGLISFDTEGNERSEQSGPFSQALVEKLTEDSITNVFFFCHGWKGDIPAAKDQYNKWIKAFVESEDSKRAKDFFPNFKPLYIGVHWPSQPWGD